MPLKRDASLIPLSHDHHHALVRVFEVRQALRRGEGLAEQVAAVREFWTHDLVPHFEAEERAVFPLLAGIGASAELVTRLLAEHAQLREMATALDATGVALAAFADLLESHVRLEERQLFPQYQQLVPDEQRAEVERRVREILAGSDDAAQACDVPRRG